LNTKRTLTFVALASALVLSAPAMARGHGGTTSHTPHHAGVTHQAAPKNTPHNSNYAKGVKRDDSGHIARSPKAKSDFKKQHPCPSTGKSSGACPGYVVDHVKPLKRGGADAPNNMQWQSKEAAKKKDKTE